mgnify:CR=1 FL=1
MRVLLTVSTVTGPRLARAVMGRPVRTSAEMVVKRPSGFWVWRTVTGMRASTAGWMVAGCSTLAPKAANSAASAKLRSGMGRASGTMRGSQVSTPSTSVQICTSSATRAAPKRAAE